MAAISLAIDSYRQDRLMLKDHPPARPSYLGDGRNNPATTTMFG